MTGLLAFALFLGWAVALVTMASERASGQRCESCGDDLVDGDRHSTLPLCGWCVWLATVRRAK